MESVFISLLYAIQTVERRAEQVAETATGWTTDPKIKDVMEKIKTTQRELSTTQLGKESFSEKVVDLANRILYLSFEQGDQSRKPLASIFNKMNGAVKQQYYYHVQELKQSINYPTQYDDIQVDRTTYLALMENMRKELEKITWDEAGIQRLLTVMEQYLSYVPEDLMEGDISLVDFSKLRAALANCISEYILAGERTGTDSQEDLDKKMFLLFSTDFSGIQKFIYTVASRGALKSLRSRSFFLEVFMEHVVDEIIGLASVSRANLIYSGGGHCYMLLPNTEKVRRGLAEFNREMKTWLIRNFGTGLYLAMAYQGCTGNELMNRPLEESPYQHLFRELSSSLSRDKLHRYSAEEVRLLNRYQRTGGERECKVCGTTDHLEKQEEICRWCKGFQEMSSDITKEDLMILCSQEPVAEGTNMEVPLPGGKGYLCFVQEKYGNRYVNTEGIRRIYKKNRRQIEDGAINLYMGDYMDNKFLDELTRQSQGIKRMGILRGDVDNLGNAFVSGFENKGAGNDHQERWKDVSIIRTAAFSSAMSLFFKYHINAILKGEDEQHFGLYQEKQKTSRHALIVYSGGDDIFLAGAWDDVVEASLDIQRAFRRFTCGKLSLSAGFGLFPKKYPMHKAAEETADLEAEAKAMDGKNAVSLFTTREAHTYPWDEFINGVIAVKLEQLRAFFDEEEQERGKAFLYRILELLRNSDKKINIARYAYLLARLEPKQESRKKRYREFSDNMYRWIFSEKDRRELITAIYIYAYLERKQVKKGEDKHE